MIRRTWKRLGRGFGYLTLDPSPRLRRLREESERTSPAAPSGRLPSLPDSAYPPGAVPLDMSGVPGWPDRAAANASWDYECRACQGSLFRVAWYTAPRGQDGEPRPPGWVIECSGCERVTLLPEAPDMTEARSAR